MKRVIWIILDSVGMGEQLDAARFGDAGTHTLRLIFQRFILMQHINSYKAKYPIYIYYNLLFAFIQLKYD